MDKALKDKVTIALLLVVLVSAIAYSKMKSGKAGSASVNSTTSLDIQRIREKLSEYNKSKDKNIAENNLRDSFKQPITAQVETPHAQTPGVIENTKELALQGVIWNGKQNLAIISGSVVSEGEYIGDAKVVSITEKGVSLLRNGSQTELKR